MALEFIKNFEETFVINDKYLILFLPFSQFGQNLEVIVDELGYFLNN